MKMTRNHGLDSSRRTSINYRLVEKIASEFSCNIDVETPSDEEHGKSRSKLMATLCGSGVR